MPERSREILLLAAVHGDEGFSIPILEGLEHDFPERFSWLVGNEAALKQGARFIDTDLNRAAPGDPYSASYEIRRAHEVLEIARSYEFVIDIHGTTAQSGIFIIVCNPTPYNIALAASLPITNVVVWTAKKEGVPNRGPLMQFVRCGVGIECGPKDSRDVMADLRRILETLMSRGMVLDPARQQRWFRVYGKIPAQIHAGSELYDFEMVTLGEESFYPLLVGQYSDTACYKMKEIDFTSMFAY